MSESNLPHLISIFLTEKVGHMGQDANCLFYMVINILQTVLYGRCVSTVTKFISQIYIYFPSKGRYFRILTDYKGLCAICYWETNELCWPSLIVSLY